MKYYEQLEEYGEYKRGNHGKEGHHYLWASYSVAVYFFFLHSITVDI